MPCRYADRYRTRPLAARGGRLKRRTIHLAFASAAAALAVLAAFQATHWRQADRLADALARPTADALPPSPEVSALADELAALNHRLWVIEDALRDCERRGEFGASFVEHARNVYRTNDRRAQLKADIDTALGHVVGDAKVYAVASAAAGASGRRGPGTG